MKMPAMILGLFCFFFSIIDTEILQQLITVKLKQPPVVKLSPMCDKVKVLVEKRGDATPKKRDKEISCELLDSYIYNSNYLLLNFGDSYKGFIEVNGYAYIVSPGEDVTVVSNSLARMYIVIRIGLAILLLFLLRRKYFYELYPAVVVTSLILLYFPGGGSFDILGYLQIYNNFPNYLDNEYSLARIFPFLVTQFLSNSIFVYKLMQVCLCCFGILHFIQSLIRDKKLQLVSFTFVVVLGCLFSLAYSYTDLIFTGLLFLKLSYLTSLIKEGKGSSHYTFVSILLAVYRKNSIVLLAFDVALFFFLKLSRRYVAVYMTAFALIYSLSYGVFIDEADTGYSGYAVLYELHPLHSKYPEELAWLRPYFRDGTLSKPRKSSLIQTYYRGDKLDDDLIDREYIAEHYEVIHQNYLTFAIEHPLEVLKQKFILFSYFLGMNVGTNSYQKNVDMISYFNNNNGDFRFFNKDRSREVSIFKLQEFRIFQNMMKYLWILHIVFILFLGYAAIKKMKIELLVLSCVLVYTLSFLIFSHGFLLHYSYYLIVITKVFFFKFYELWREKCQTLSFTE
ncbi:hypothetical protein [Bacteriovorax sp. Seq25_V]|uniref:hypothetical protein n=1 Tax=Bacteriovorax sp. Seq25_V TaxID=1201288 RepID=UPI00038A22ED|nr:hypothetical protein [Bacteriovorax sp. Seq25_V]EQC46898.1 putative membrane protein [Bacteriovorax sp. Seq25_V]